MENEYGTQMTSALRAVLQMHSDSSRLLRDLDKQMGAYHTPFDSAVATANQSSSLNSSRFMAQGLFRLYVLAKTDLDVIGVNICFFDDENKKPAFNQPLFVTAKLTYDTTSFPERGEWYWHPWTAFVRNGICGELDSPAEIDGSQCPKTVIRATVNAKPLFEIRDLEVALALIRSVAPEVASIQ